MCGLLGFATNGKSRLSPDLVTFILTSLMAHNEKRGGDSYGLGIVRPLRKEVKTYKVVGKITKDTHNKTWLNGLSDVYEAVANEEPLVVIGHNRKATTGANTQRNAHPFQFGKPDRPGDFIIGAHNGMVSYWERFIKGWNITRKIEVDSEVIFRGILHNKDEAGVIGALENHAVMALTYMRDLENLRFYRGSNPLSISRGEGFTFWSSVEQHLSTATFGLKHHVDEVKSNTFLNLNVNDMSLSALVTPKRVAPPFKLETLGSRHSSKYDGRNKWDPFERALPAGESATSGGKSGTSSDYHNEPSAKVLVVVPEKHILDKCALCTETGPSWKMLWFQDSPLCPNCYYVMVEDDALKNQRRTIGAG